MAGHVTSGSWRRAPIAALAAAVVLLAVLFVQRATAEENPIHAAAHACDGEHWVGGWTAAPHASSLGRPDDVDGPARTFVDQTLRMVMSPGVGGSAVRVRIGNRFGAEPVTVGSATIAGRASGADLVPGSTIPLTFAGRPGVVIAPGDEALSDPVVVGVRPFAALAVTYHVMGTAVVDQHQWAQSTQFASPPHSGDHTSDETGDAFTDELSGWFGVTGVDVLAPRRVGAVVALGDSITDGLGSTPDADRRWTDALARRFQVAAVPLSVVNAGIAGNHIATSGTTSEAAIGPSLLERLDRDALQVAGVTDLFVFEGINDIFKAEPETDVAARLIAGYEVLVERAHGAGVRVVGATITPAGLPLEKELARLAVNEWIRTSGAFDAVVDFDVVARDPGNASQVRPAWDAQLGHLTDAGYDALAAAIDTEIFQGTGC